MKRKASFIHTKKEAQERTRFSDIKNNIARTKSVFYIFHKRQEIGGSVRKFLKIVKQKETKGP